MTDPTPNAPSRSLVPSPSPLDERAWPVEPADLYRAALVTLREAVAHLYGLVQANPDDLDGQARTAVLTDVLRRDLAMVEDAAKDAVRALADEENEDSRHAYEEEHGTTKGWRRSPRIVVEGVGAFELTDRGSKRVWDDQATLQRLLDESGGSFSDFLELLPVAARLEWRSTPFQDRGVNVYQEGLVEKIPGTPTVRYAGKVER